MKTVSHHNVHVLRFNPHAPGQLLSAGRDNIRTHRLHDGALGLSGGQQQRLCIARAIVHRPEILLMDEPCASLDPVATLKIEELLCRLRESYTMVIVTHNLEQARRVADRVAFFYQGRLIEAGPTLELFATPRDARTEAYVRGRIG